MVEQPAVNRLVVGSSPTCRAFFVIAPITVSGVVGQDSCQFWTASWQATNAQTASRTFSGRLSKILPKTYSRTPFDRAFKIDLAASSLPGGIQKQIRPDDD